MGKDKGDSVVIKRVPLPPVVPADLPKVAVLTQYDAALVRWTLVPVVFVEQDTGLIALANRAAEELFGYNLGEMTGLSIHALVPESLRATHAAHVERFKAEPYQTARSMGAGLIVQGHHRKDGDFPCNVALYRFVNNGVRYIMAEIVDMRVGGRLPVPADPPPWQEGDPDRRHPRG